MSLRTAEGRHDQGVLRSRDSGDAERESGAEAPAWCRGAKEAQVLGVDQRLKQLNVRSGEH